MKMVMSMKRMLMESHKIQTQTYTMSFRARHTRNTRATTFTLKRLFQCMISGKVSTTCSQFHIYFILTVNTYWYHLHTNSIKHSFSRGHLVFLTCCMYGSGIHKFEPSIVLQNSYAAMKILLVWPMEEDQYTDGVISRLLLPFPPPFDIVCQPALTKPFYCLLPFAVPSVSSQYNLSVSNSHLCLF